MKKRDIILVICAGLGSAIIFALANLGAGKRYEVTKEPHRVISVTPAKPRSVHEEMNPALMLHLDNGDSIRVSISKPIPDTIWYEYRKIIKD